MKTRQDYLQGRCTHREYYGEIVKEAGITVSDELRDECARSSDPHYNNIKLNRWDIYGTAIRSKVAPLFRQRDDQVSLAGTVCVMKEAARQAVESYQPRKRINDALINDKYPCVAVSEAFVEKMRDCVPPAYMSYTGAYYIVQCGEPADHNSEGLPLYETYMLMTQKAINEKIADARMVKDQWYFVGLKTQAK